MTQHEACRALARLLVVSAGRLGDCLGTGARGEAKVDAADALADDPGRVLIALTLLHRRQLADARSPEALARADRRLAARRAALTRRQSRE